MDKAGETGRPSASRVPPAALDKSRALARVRARISELLAGMTQSQKGTQAGAVHEETRAEDPKDTRATEASYLARGLAGRARRSRGSVARLA